MESLSEILNRIKEGPATRARLLAVVEALEIALDSLPCNSASDNAKDEITDKLAVALEERP
jgi:hypothetical protein